jgi:hypothetical protein
MITKNKNAIVLWTTDQERKTMKLKIDFDEDQLDKLLHAKLNSLMKLLQYDLNRRKEGTGMAIFDTDLDTDVKIMKDHIKAFKTVLKYYG